MLGRHHFGVKRGGGREQRGSRVIALELDITSEAGWEWRCDETVARVRIPRCNVNNAGIVETASPATVVRGRPADDSRPNFMGPLTGHCGAPRLSPRARQWPIVTRLQNDSFLPFRLCELRGVVSTPCALLLRGSPSRNEHVVLFTIVHPTSTETPMLRMKPGRNERVRFRDHSVSAAFVARHRDGYRRQGRTSFMPPRARPTFIKIGIPDSSSKSSRCPEHSVWTRSVRSLV